MKNYIQPGNYITVAAPNGGITAGAGLKFNAGFGVAATTAAQGDPVEVATEGVYELTAETHASAQAFAVGEVVYWDDTAKRCTQTSTNNTKIGFAAAAKVSTADKVQVRLVPAV